MNEKKIAFIMCSNDELYERECISYIEKLALPAGFEREVLTVKEAASMASGYNEAMQESDAKYKIYLHQDVFILHHNFINDILELFSNPQIGMVGMVGGMEVESIPVMWFGERVGKLYTHAVDTACSSVLGEVEGRYQEVQAVDGFLMATQYDLKWREDLFQGWDFYDVSQSMEFRRKGYQVVVPHMEEPWCIHDDGILNLDHYYEAMEIFLKEYATLERV